MVKRHTVRLAAAVVMALAALAASPAHAQRAERQAEQEFRLGYRALQAGDCTRALIHYRRSLELVVRPRTIYNIAICEEHLGDGVSAWRDYHAFLRLAEDRDMAIVAEARARLDALRKRLRGRVTVASNPGGASVYVDGERTPRGETPLTLSLEPGAHVLRISTMPSNAVVERNVEVAPDEITSLHVELAMPSWISVRAEPADAIIAPRSGGTPTTGRLELAVKPGRHSFTIRRDGYHADELEIDAVAGRTHEARVVLRPQPAKAHLIVEGVPGALVTIDGARPRSSESTASTLRMRGIASGMREIEVTRMGHVRWRQDVHFAADETVTIALDLPPERSRTVRTVGWSLGGLGAASAVGGAIVGVLALRDMTSSDPLDHDRGKRRALAADGMFVVSAGAFFFAWRLLRGDKPTVTIQRARGGS